jgi:hypothetical protein
MATRFYLPSTGTPDISPAYAATWAQTTNAARINLVTTRINSAMTNQAGVTGLAAANQNELLRQFISAALAAQTLTGTLKGQIRMFATTAATWYPVIRVAKVSSGGTVTEILAATRSTDGAWTASTSIRNQRFEQGTDDFVLDLPASTTIDADDRLIVEIGFWDTSANTGRTATMNFGDDSVTDLPEDESTTAANNPWVEFTHNFTFGGGRTVLNTRPFPLGLRTGLAWRTLP